MTQPPRILADVVNQLLVRAGGDVGTLSKAERQEFLKGLCESLDIPYNIQPFDFLRGRDGRLILYAKASLAYYIAQRKGLTFPDYRTELQGALYIHRVLVRDQDGRELWASGCVWMAGVKGDEAANNIMRAETKAFRRGILRIAGMAFLDESELDTVAVASADQTVARPGVVDRK